MFLFLFAFCFFFFLLLFFVTTFLLTLLPSFFFETLLSTTFESIFKCLEFSIVKYGQYIAKIITNKQSFDMVTD